jgi:hypothetical protein
MESVTGNPHSNWGSLIWFWKKNQIRERQGETQADLMLCQVADESVVVNKSRPMKAGNRLEEKTGTTWSQNVFRDAAWSKACGRCEGRKRLRKSLPI